MTTKSDHRSRIWAAIRTDYPGLTGVPAVVWDDIEEHNADTLTMYRERPQAVEADDWLEELAFDVRRMLDYERRKSGLGVGEAPTAGPELPAGGKRELERAAAYTAVIEEALTENKDLVQGEALPPMPAITTSAHEWRHPGFGHVTITVTVLPWVSPQAVADAYRQLQERMLGGRRHYAQDGPIALVRWVSEQRTAAAIAGAPPPTWTTLYRNWKDKPVYADWRSFKRAYLRARRWLFPEINRFWESPG